MLGLTEFTESKTRSLIGLTAGFTQNYPNTHNMTPIISNHIIDLPIYLTLYTKKQQIWLMILVKSLKLPSKKHINLKLPSKKMVFTQEKIAKKKNTGAVFV